MDAELLDAIWSMSERVPLDGEAADPEAAEATAEILLLASEAVDSNGFPGASDERLQAFGERLAGALEEADLPDSVRSASDWEVAEMHDVALRCAAEFVEENPELYRDAAAARRAEEAAAAARMAQAIDVAWRQARL